jgi:ketosteroid isomerase-like protein
MKTPQLVIHLSSSTARALLIAGALIFLNAFFDGHLLREAGGAPLHAAQPAADEAAVRAVVTRFHTAVTTGDAAGAMALVGPDALFLEAGGVETRSEYEKNHLPGDIEFEKTVGVKRSPIRVVVAGDAAWATCTSEFKGTYQTRTIDSLGTELMVLSRGAGGWQIRAIHWSSRARPVQK